MVKVITKSDFRDEFQRYGRGAQFSYEALGAIYDYMEEIDENWELDVIAICCDFTEYESIEEFASNYGEDYESVDDVERVYDIIRLSGDSFVVIGG